MTAFGQIIPPTEIEAKAKEILEAWFYTYLRALEAETGRDNLSLPNIKTWEFASDDDKFPENHTPSLQLTWDVCNTTGHGDGLAGVIDMSVLVFVEAPNFKSVRSLASAYAMTAAAIVAQKFQNEPLFAGGVSDSTLGVPAVTHRDHRRFRAMGTCDFTLTVNGILNPLFEPEDIAEEAPPGDYPTVQDADHVVIDVDAVEPE